MAAAGRFGFHRDSRRLSGPERTAYDATGRGQFIQYAGHRAAALADLAGTVCVAQAVHRVQLAGLCHSRRGRADSNSAASSLTSPVQIFNSAGTAGNGQAIQSIVQNCGAVYFVTGNTNFAERAWLELSNACTFPAWRVGSTDGLGQGEMTFGVGLGYDWFYNYLTPARRNSLTNGMVTLGVNPSQGEYPGAWYVSDTANNWAMVFNCGASELALALANDLPAVSQNLLNSALTSMASSIGHFTTDNGGYYEDSEYWDYGVTHLINLLAGVETSLGTLFSLDDTPGLTTRRCMRFTTPDPSWAMAVSISGIATRATLRATA